MKVKTTRKAIVNGSYNVKCAGYCDLSYLLNNHSPIAYTCGVYGWNFDVYEVYGVTICTGYRNMPGARLEKISEYEEKAVNAFEIYNCTDNETGRYTAFYIPVVTVDRFTGETPTAYTLGTVKQYDYSVMEG